MQHTYERDGDAIYRQSFAIIRAEAALGRFNPVEELAVVRMIHAAGLVGLEQHVAFTPGMAHATRQALQNGALEASSSRFILASAMPSFSQPSARPGELATAVRKASSATA